MYATDRQTDRGQTDRQTSNVRQKHRLLPPPISGGGITIALYSWKKFSLLVTVAVWRFADCVCGGWVLVWRPIHCAVAGNHVIIVRELLRCGADVTKQNGAKRSVLQLSKGRAVRQLIHGMLRRFDSTSHLSAINWSVSYMSEGEYFHKIWCFCDPLFWKYRPERDGKTDRRTNGPLLNTPFKVGRITI